MPRQSASCYIETPKAKDAEHAIELSRAAAAKQLGGSDGLAAQSASRAAVSWLREWSDDAKSSNKKKG